MMPTREDLELYVSGNYDGDAAALERAVAEDPELRAQLADEARLEMLLRDAGAEATFCPACDDLVRDARCNACGAALRPGGYVVERVLVSNAHGRMYVARDADGRRVALKELAFVQAPKPDAVNAFEREARFLRALEHPAIPRFVASFQEGQGVHARYYLAQELVEGTPLDATLDEHWYREDEIVALARSVLEVLVYLQGLSPMVIHRDVKPANLVRRGDGSIALVDFGAAHVAGTTAGSTAIGTFGYMPVEQLAGIVDATTDVYALGASLIHLLVRQEPWKILTDRGIAINVSAPLRAWLDRAVAADPKQRFAGAKEALAALEARERIPVPRAGRRVRSALVTGAAALAVLAGAGGVASYLALHGRHHAATPSPPPAAELSRLKLKLPDGESAALTIDGKLVADGIVGPSEIPVRSGQHHVVVSGGGKRGDCMEDVMFPPGDAVVMECWLPPAPPPPPPAPPQLPAGKKVDVSFTKAKLHDVARFLGGACGFNVVVADTVDVPITIRLAGVPCGEALEELLSAQGLGYVYDPGNQLVRVGVRAELVAEREQAAGRAQVDAQLGIHDQALPEDLRVDLDVQNAPLRATLQQLANQAGLNLVLPDGIDGKITVQAHQVPWGTLARAILQAHGLWYRYRPEGKLLRIAVAGELQNDDELELTKRSTK